MTASLKYVKRLIGVMLILLGLISWLALQTPAMPIKWESSHNAYDSFAFDEAVLKLRIAHLGLRNAGLRSAVNSPSQSQSATISGIRPEISL
jgi:hypothetical protein